MATQKQKMVTLSTEKKAITLNYSDLRKGVVTLRAVNHTLRQDIIELLSESEPMTVTDIYVKLRLEQSVASQHLAILRRAGIVITDRKGKYIYYTLNSERLALIAKLVEHINEADA